MINKKLFIPIILISVALLGCGERTIEPFEHIEGYYSIYGALSVGDDDNYIRVRRLDTPLLAESSEFKGEVTFYNLQANTEQVLEPVIVEFDGNYTHNFHVNEIIQPQNEYRIRVEDDEGNVSESNINTPTTTAVSYDPNSGISCKDPVNVVLGNFNDGERVLFEIGFGHQGTMVWHRIDLFNDYIIYDYDTGEVSLEMSPLNFLVEVFTPPLPDNPYLNPYSLSPTVSCAQVTEKRVYIRYYHLSNDWESALTNDLLPLAIETGRIDNGIGFLGGYYSGGITIPFTPY